MLSIISNRKQKQQGFDYMELWALQFIRFVFAFRFD